MTTKYWMVGAALAGGFVLARKTTLFSGMLPTGAAAPLPAPPGVAPVVTRQAGAAVVESDRASVPEAAR